MAQQQQSIVIASSLGGSSSIIDRKGLSGDLYFRWDSLKSFVYIAETFASPFSYTINAYTRRFTPDSLYTYVVMAAVVGVPYMYMEFFIKQYTGKVDFQETLNPLLKGLNYGIIMISMIHLVNLTDDLATGIYYLILSFTFIPPWDDCSRSQRVNDTNEACVSTFNITVFCDKKGNETISSKLLSTSRYYLTQNDDFRDETVVTRRVFLVVLAWIANFFICTIPESMLVKVFYLTFIIRLVSGIVMFFYVSVSAVEFVSTAVLETFNFTLSEIDITQVDIQLLYKFGVGVVTMNDYGSISPFTAIGNAVVLFVIIDFFLDLIRVITFHIQKHVVQKCTQYNNLIYHSFAFATMPLTANFFYCQRLVLISIYTLLTLNLLSHRVAVTSTLSKMLRHDFKKIKEIYINGIICFMECWLTIIVVTIQGFSFSSILQASEFLMQTIACLKAAIIFYVYGVSKFSTDIHFWLGHKPSRYWHVTWVLLPVIFGKLGALFKPNIKYGPPDAEDRRRRRRYDEALTIRACTHNCNILDDKFTCDHDADARRMLLNEDDISDDVLSIFEAEASRKSRVSEMMDFNIN